MSSITDVKVPPSSCIETKISKMHLITGFPKSGTQYMNEVLNRLGIISYHERCESDCQVMVSSIHAPAYEIFGKILLQVRHPLDVFATCQRVMRLRYHRAWFKTSFLDKMEIRGFSELGPYAVLAAWLQWNTSIEKKCKPDIIYRVEDIKSGSNKIYEILDILGLDVEKSIDLPKPMEKKRPDWIDLSDVQVSLRDCLVEKANEYGYEI